MLDAALIIFQPAPVLLNSFLKALLCFLIFFILLPWVGSLQKRQKTYKKVT